MGKKNKWRIETSPTITEFIRTHRLRWFGHIQCMSNTRTREIVLNALDWTEEKDAEENAGLKQWDEI